MATTETKIEWTLTDGRTAVVTVTETTAAAVNADGHVVEVDKHSLSICAEVDGATVGYGEPVDCPEIPGVSGKIGILGMRPENYNRVMTVIDGIKAGEAYQADAAKRAENLKAHADLDRSRSTWMARNGFED